MAKLIKEAGSGICAYGKAFYIEDTGGNIIFVPDAVLGELKSAIESYEQDKGEPQNEKPD